MRAVGGLGMVLVVGMACDAISPVVTAGPPINACPAHPCAAYKHQPGSAPSCSDDGVCAVAASPGDTLLVIGLAVDSLFAPGRTYLTTLDRATEENGPCAIFNCSPPTCLLPLWVQDTNLYVVSPNAALSVRWDLGNMGFTALPAQATYRPLLPLGGSMADAIDLGLPLDPVPATNSTTFSASGPEGGPALQFQAYMQPGCYERTLQPYPPFSEAFPPEVKPWSRATGMNPVDHFDTTSEETELPMGRPNLTIPTFPTFQIARAEGLDGWTAYLRSIATKRIYSNVAPLSGSLVPEVILATNHLGATGDALDGLELVMAPPAGTPQPTEVIAPVLQELPFHETYPSMPLPIAMSGRISTPAGVAVPATVVFTAMDIFERTGTTFPPNFEFVTQVQTSTDRRSGASTYSVVLPAGDYAIAVRPTDDSSAVTLSARAVGGPAAGGGSVDLAVGQLVPVSGYVFVADERSLGEAIVEAVPTACASNGTVTVPDASNTQSLALRTGSEFCMPRAAQTITRNDGSFILALDPGGYLLRVRPVEGSRLPWTMQPLAIDPASGPVFLDRIYVPAPVRVRMTLDDTSRNAISNAIVRIFTDPSQGTPPVELGRAITDYLGNYEIDLAPPTP